MAGSLADSRGPTYISSHSADVILSEIRPIKLQADALRSINVLLDEVLYNILAAARSLSTEKLRAGLLKVLPTSLGKDALLEAEVELRAYWDRTTPSSGDMVKTSDDQRNFHLQWAFELLRLKCEAYSTLNEADEDPDAESRLQNRMGQAGGLSPPKASLVAPASLYLTAILEALCEHILSNVARVTARDSSKASATTQDVFVALCEDNSIYALFRQMKVYEQIEQLSKASKPRRSKSLSVGDQTSNQDLVSSKGSGYNSRLSSDSMGSAITPGSAHVPNASTRGSSDKTRSMKMFGKVSTDREVINGDHQRGHKKSDSFRSAETRRAISPNPMTKPYEDAALLEEFDNLMLSDATMKVSLTPDRLKSMDSFNKERSQRSGFSSLKFDSDHSSLPRTAGRQGPLRAVDLIVEDEEETSPAKSTATKNHSGTTTTSISAPSKLFRTRSSSASHPPSATRSIVKKSSRTDVNGSTASSPVTRERRGSQVGETIPSRNRKALPHSDAVDLDDMAGTSGDDETQFGSKMQTKPRTPLAVSAKTQDLIDFLSEGPPGDLTPNPKVNASAVSLESGKSRGSGRLQRMISKLSMGNSNDKPQSRVVNGDTRKSNRRPSTSLSSTSVQSKAFSTNSALANRPIPPRPPPPPVSPPSSSSQDSLVEVVAPVLHPRNASIARPTLPATEAKPVTIGTGKENRIAPSPTSFPNGQLKNADKERIDSETVPPLGVAAVHPAPIKINDTGVVKSICETCASKKVAARAPATLSTTETKHASVLSLSLARDIQRQMSAATTVEECRLLFDMFLAKSGIPMEPANDDFPYPSPAPSNASSSDITLENFLAELLLSSDASTDASSVHSEAGKAGPVDASISPEDPVKPDVTVSSQTEKDIP